MTTGKVACYRCGNTSRVKVEIRLSNGAWVPVCPFCVRQLERPRRIRLRRRLQEAEVIGGPVFALDPVCGNYAVLDQPEDHLRPNTGLRKQCL